MAQTTNGRAEQNVAASPEDAARRLRPFDFRNPSKMAREHVRRLELTHETFQRSLGAKLSSLLRTMVRLELLAIDQVTYDEYVRAMPNPTVIGQMTMSPLPGFALIEMSTPTALTLVDRQLGGNGRTTLNRRPTELESRLISDLLKEAEEALRLVRAGNRPEDIAQAEATVAAFQGALAAIEIQLNELQIRASLDGVVEAIELQPGDMVGAGAPVLSLMDTRTLWVRAYVPESRLNIMLDQEVRVTTDSFSNESFRGKVTFISRQAEFTPRNVQTPEERSKQVFRIKVTLLDGLRNLLPFGVTRSLQTEMSTLVDAYKQAESFQGYTAAVYTMSSILTDRAEPSEALKATVVWSTGLANPKLLLSMWTLK